MAGSNSVGSSFTPLTNDGNAGSNGFIGSINGASNAAGLTFTLPAGAAANGVTVDNHSVYPVRLTQTLAAGTTAPAGWVGQTAIVSPQGSISLAYNGDDQFSFVAQVISAPAAGTVVTATAATVAPAASVIGTALIIANFVNA